MLQITLVFLCIICCSNSRHYLIETEEETISEIKPVNDSLDSLVNRYVLDFIGENLRDLI